MQSPDIAPTLGRSRHPNVAVAQLPIVIDNQEKGIHSGNLPRLSRMAVESLGCVKVSCQYSQYLFFVRLGRGCGSFAAGTKDPAQVNDNSSHVSERAGYAPLISNSN